MVHLHLFRYCDSTDIICLATSVYIERVFSCGRLILPHVRNGLSAQSIRALLCLGEWSLLGLVRDADVLVEVRGAPIVDGNDVVVLEDRWDFIVLPVF